MNTYQYLAQRSLTRLARTTPPAPYLSRFNGLGTLACAVVLLRTRARHLAAFEAASLEARELGVQTGYPAFWEEVAWQVDELLGDFLNPDEAIYADPWSDVWAGIVMIGEEVR